MMSTLSFKFVQIPNNYLFEARPLVDGEDIIENIDKYMVGLDPDEFFKQPALYGEGDLYVGRCGCGDIGCGFIKVEVSRSGDQIVWKDSQFKASFVAEQYDQAISSAAEDRSWEDVTRSACKAIDELDFTEASILGLDYNYSQSGPHQVDCIELTFLRREDPM